MANFFTCWATIFTTHHVSCQNLRARLHRERKFNLRIFRIDFLTIFDKSCVGACVAYQQLENSYFQLIRAPFYRSLKGSISWFTLGWRQRLYLSNNRKRRDYCFKPFTAVVSARKRFLRVLQDPILRSVVSYFRSCCWKIKVGDSLDQTLSERFQLHHW